MSQENVEIVRRGIDAFNRGEEAFDLVDPEIEWTTTGIFVEPRTRSGHEGVREYLNALADDFQQVHVEPTELIAVDEHVIVPMRLTGRGRLSGVPVEVNATLPSERADPARPPVHEAGGGEADDVRPQPRPGSD